MHNFNMRMEKVKPTIHLSGFHAAFQHDEILLMVDVPKDQVALIEQILHNKTRQLQKKVLAGHHRI